MTAPTRERPQPAHRMDPRIKRRRVEVKRDEGRRRLRVLIGVIGAALAVLAVVGLVQSPVLAVRKVDVVGARQTEPAEVVAAAGLDHHPRMVDVSSGLVARRVRRLPWVNTAKATRVWPATVRIQITERVAIAQLPSAAGEWAATDATGRVLSTGPQDPDLAVLAGLPPAGEPASLLGTPGDAVLAVASHLPDDLRPRVKEIVAVGDGVDLHLKPAGTVHLGGTDRLADKLVAVATVVARVDLRNLKILDVRVPDAPVLTRS